jgi:hypothetical protein
VPGFFVSVRSRCIYSITGAEARAHDAGMEATTKLQKARLAEIEGAPAKTMADVFRGGYMPNTTYARGDLIVDRGALWLAMQASDERPGSTSAWKLILKSPR